MGRHGMSHYDDLAQPKHLQEVVTHALFWEVAIIWVMQSSSMKQSQHIVYTSGQTPCGRDGLQILAWFSISRGQAAR